MRQIIVTLRAEAYGERAKAEVLVAGDVLAIAVRDTEHQAVFAVLELAAGDLAHDLSRLRADVPPRVGV